jgi:hypothetical protein
LNLKGQKMHHPKEKKKKKPTTTPPSNGGSKQLSTKLLMQKKSKTQQAIFDKIVQEKSNNPKNDLLSQKIYNRALLQFQKFKSIFKDDVAMAMQKSIEYYEIQLRSEDKNRVLVDKNIKNAYKFIFNQDIKAVEIKPNKLKKEKIAKIKAEAKALFEKWKRPQIKGGYTKFTRIREARKYYFSEISKVKTKEDRDMYSVAIKEIYREVFSEDII